MCRERQCPSFLIWKSWKLLGKNPAGLQKLHLSLKAASISVKSTHTLEARECLDVWFKFWTWGLVYYVRTLMSNFNVDSFKKLICFPKLKGGRELFYRFSSCTEKPYMIMARTIENSPTPTVMKWEMKSLLDMHNWVWLFNGKFQHWSGTFEPLKWTFSGVWCSVLSPE